MTPPYEGSSGLGWRNAPGLPRLESATFTGEFPIAGIDFEDPELPVKVSLEAFTPFIPLEEDDSGLPVAILRYRVSNPGRDTATVSVAFSIDNPVGAEGRTNEFRTGDGFAGLFMHNPFLDGDDALKGTFALCVLNPAGGHISHLRGWRGGSRWRVGPLSFWDDFSEDGQLGPEPAIRNETGSLCLQREIPAGGETEYAFLLAWHFPNRTPQRCGWGSPKGEGRTLIGNHYCTRFGDAWEAARHAVSRLPDLEKRTREFVAAVRATTLPDAVKDAAMSNLSTLVTQTCFRTSGGQFHGFEGCNDQRGCCFGSCTHVWNYEATTAHIFPRLSRSLREQQFSACLDDEGRMDYRMLLPSGKAHHGRAAADGQMGTIIKLYLDWRLSGDTEWLRKLWPSARKALEYAWQPGGWDGDRDGVMEGTQHNTYDVEFFGPNPLCGVWYLGALRAGEEMARAVGDAASADEYRRLFARGSKWIDANLFNGEYYVQKIQGIPKDKIAKGLMSGMGTADTENPDFQMGDGCLVDQLVGQYYAEVAGLGLLLDGRHVRKTLESIYKYNYKRDLFRHESVQRIYALNDEAALVICDYSRAERPKIPFPYFAEVMTGFEYSAAILMLYQGMVEEGVELIANIRRRYDGERRSPWNEAECGHHYARAMASWAAMLALSGFQYHGVEKSVIARPRVNSDRFSSFWSAGTAWGTFSCSEKEFSLSVMHGVLSCRSVALAPRKRAGGRSVATLQGQSLNHELRRDGNDATFVFAEEVRLREGDRLVLRV